MSVAAPGAPEPISLYGLQFPVDEQVSLGSNSVKVVLGGEAEIMDGNAVADFVVRRTLQNPAGARGFSPVSIQKFIESALANKDSQRAAWGIEGLLAHLESDRETVSGYLTALSDRSEAADPLQEALAFPGVQVPDDLWAKLAVGVAPRNIPWFQTRYAASGPKTKALAREELRQRSLSALRSREFARLDGILAVQRSVVGEEDPEFRDLTVLISRLREALDRAARGEMDPLFALGEVTKGNKESSELVAPFLIDAAHQQIAEQLRQGEASRALILLARIDFTRRTPQTHELTRQALERVSGSTETTLANSMVDLYLRRISEVDPTLKRAYIEALDKQVRLLFNSGRVDLAGDYVGKLASVRPDPSRENDSVRILQAVAYLRRGMRASAYQSVSEIQTGIPLLGRLELLWAGYYGDPLSGVLWLLIPLIVILMMWFRGRAEILLGSPKPKEMPEEEEDDESDRPSGFAITGARLMSPSMQEYNRCLQALGLKPGASLRQVKSHYRSLIKKVHPDLNKNLSAVERERFVMLTKTYDRLLELRRELKFPDS